MIPAGDRGAVTAEFAIALPAAAIVLVLGAGVLAAGATGVRLQDATADAARLAARGEPSDRVVAAVTDAVPGAVAAIEDRGDLVCVTSSARVVWTSVAATSCALAGGL